MLFFKDMLDEDETTMFSQNVGQRSSSKGVPHSRRMHISCSTAGGEWRYEHGAFVEILKYSVKNAVPVPICQHQILQ
jgi:hypothetical protein